MMGRPYKIREPIVPVNKTYSAGTLILIWDQMVWNCMPSCVPNFVYEIECSSCHILVHMKKIDIDRHLNQKWLCKSCSRLGKRNPMYGIPNPCSTERRENIRKSRFEMWKRPGYRLRHYEGWSKSVEKRHGWNVGKQKIEFEKYRQEVYRYTNRNDLSILEGFDRRGKMRCGEDNTNLDHIYSIHDGFKNNIPPEIVGCMNNLRFIHWKENNIKSGSSDITKEELLERYNNLQ